jgi:hypothetical protein
MGIYSRFFHIPKLVGHSTWQWCETLITHTENLTVIVCISEKYKQKWINKLSLVPCNFKSRDSSVGIVTRLWAGQSGFYGSIPDRGWDFFSSPPRPEWLWDPPSLLYNEYQELFRWGKAAGAWSWPPPSSAGVKNACSYTSTPPIRLHGVVLS